MSALFAKIVKQALLTFDRSNCAAFTDNFRILKQLTDRLTFRDINLDPAHFSEEIFQRPNKAPCTYVNVFDNMDVIMSVFILRADYTMPLHDHPMMHGILRALSGTLQVQSYSKILSNDQVLYDKSETQIRVTNDQFKVVTPTTECAVLTPKESNFHEITAVGQISAFFDILSPPYNSDMPVFGRRPCNFYEIISTNCNELLISQIPPPMSYVCDNAYYKKPKFILSYEEPVSESDADVSPTQ